MIPATVISTRHGTRRPDAPTVSISMHGDVVVAQVCAPLDLDATRALVGAVEGAVRSGSAVAVDLGCESSLPPASEVVVSRSSAAPGAPIDDGRVTVRSAGYVQLAAGDSYWMIDLTSARMCRGAGPIDPSFVAGEAWTPVQAIWLTSTSMHALTATGSYLSRSVRWTFDS